MRTSRASIDEPADGTATGEIPQQPIRIVVVDDHQFMRELIIRMLGRQNGRYTVVAEAGDAKGAVAACEEFQPDLLILDINLPDESGIDAVPRLKQASPRTRILLCTAYVTDDRVINAMRSGAHGFVEKTNTWNDFVDAVERVGSGEHYFSSHHSGALTDIEPAERGGLTPASVVGLRGREKDVLQLIAHGNTSKEIAAKLGISVGTVETHRTNLMKKAAYPERRGTCGVRVSSRAHSVGAALNCSPGTRASTGFPSSLSDFENTTLYNRL